MPDRTFPIYIDPHSTITGTLPVFPPSPMPMQYIPEDQAPDRPSKSQLKRHMERLQRLGEELVKLHPEALGCIPLGEDVRAAIAEYHRLKGREGMRRQLQYIGRLMRSEDGAAISAALVQAQSGGLEEKRRLHLTEQWRERLLEQGDSALGGFLDEHPQADRQRLRQLIRAAALEHERGKPPAAARKLFRYLRDILFGQ